MKFNQQITTHVHSIDEAGGLEFVGDRMKELQLQEISFVRPAPSLPSSDSSSEESDQGGSLQCSMILEPVPTPPTSDSSSDQGESLQSSTILEPDHLSPETPAAEHSVSKQASPDVVQQILDIIQGYSQNESNATGDAWLGRKGAESQVRTFVDASLPVDFCIPAFPWKSVNRVDKVLGSLPDLGEELALGRLQSLCDDIQDVYPPGAFVTITSDGLVYNDAFGVPDEEVYIYGSALRQMATAKGFDRLKFMRMMNLLGLLQVLTQESELWSIFPSKSDVWTKSNMLSLSIHRSIGLQKTSFPLVPQPDHFSMTPWHCCIAVTHKGEFKILPRSGRGLELECSSGVWVLLSERRVCKSCNKRRRGFAETWSKGDGEGQEAEEGISNGHRTRVCLMRVR